MKLRILGLLLLLGALTGGFVTAANIEGSSPQARWAIVKYDYPVRVGSATLVGTCLIVHDDAKMAKGEPCTSIYRIGPNGQRELLVSFHCVPSQQKPTSVFTTAVRTVPGLTTLREMVNYQFAGEPEAHGVPADIN